MKEKMTKSAEKSLKSNYSVYRLERYGVLDDKIGATLGLNLTYYPVDVLT